MASTCFLTLAPGVGPSGTFCLVPGRTMKAPSSRKFKPSDFRTILRVPPMRGSGLCYWLNFGGSRTLINLISGIIAHNYSQESSEFIVKQTNCDSKSKILWGKSYKRKKLSISESTKSLIATLWRRGASPVSRQHLASLKIILRDSENMLAGCWNSLKREGTYLYSWKYSAVLPTCCLSMQGLSQEARHYGK